MGNLLAHVTEWILLNPSWTDLILAAGILIQGELTILLAVFLIVNGSITWGQFIGATLPALFVGELSIYVLGRVLRTTRFGWRFYKRKKKSRRNQFYTYHLKRNMGTLFLVGKFIPGTNFIMIFLTGWTRTKFSEFLKTYTKSALFWFSVITAVSYFLMSGLSLLRTERIVRDVEIGIVVIFAAIFGFEQILRHFLKKYSYREEIPEETEKQDEEKPIV